MTVTNTTNKITAAGNGVTTTFSFPFKIFDSSQLVVYKVDIATGVATLQVLTTDYTVSISTSTEGGSITYVVAPTSGQNSFISRVVAYDQSASIRTEGPLPASQIENQLDKTTMEVIQIKEITDRCAKVGATSTAVVTLPEPVDGYIPSWSGTAGAMVNVINPANAATAAAASAAAALSSQSAAAASAVAGAASQVAAAASAAAAAASAASTNLPAITIADALKLVQVNSAGTGYQALDASAFNTVLGMASKIFKQAKGAAVASSNTTTLGEDGNVFNITGTTQINTITTKQAGTVAFLYFTSTVILSTSGNLKMPAGVAYTTATNDMVIVVCDGTNWYVHLPVQANHGTQLFTASGTFTVPQGVTQVRLTMISGGGSGGSSSGNGGGGGSSGAYVIDLPYTVTPAAALTVTVGAGGIAVANNTDSEGLDGGVTTFDTVTVPAGKGGRKGSVQTGGAAIGGVTAATATTGGARTTFISAAGANGSGTNGGGGGGSPFGAGGNGSAGGTGVAATANTGCGGGGGSNGGGGNGGSGFVLVEW